MANLRPSILPNGLFLAKERGCPLHFMAKPEHLEILKQGREVWNQWRMDQPSVKPDLSAVDFTQAPAFEDSAIWGRRLMDNADDAKRLLLGGFNLSGVDFYKANLSHAELNKADLSDAKLVHTNLSSARLHKAKLNGAQLWGAMFCQTDLREVKLGRTHLVDIDFSEACLDGIQLRGQNLSGARFINSHLRNADLREANLTGARLNGADLRNADLTGATLTNSLWTEANVAGVKYNRHLLPGRCGSIGGVGDMYGMPIFRRDVMDQDYLDTLLNQLKQQRPRAEWLWGFEWKEHALRPQWFVLLDFLMALFGTYPRQFRNPLKPLPERKRRQAPPQSNVEQQAQAKAEQRFGLNPVFLRRRGLLSALWSGRHRLGGSFAKFPAFFGAFIGLILPVIVMAGVPSFSWVLITGVIGFLSGAFSSGWLFHRLGYWLWHWVDYGRDWQGVFIAGLVVIGIIGAGYNAMDGVHVNLHYPEAPGPVSSGTEAASGTSFPQVKHWFYPWFVAAMGFATLGIADLAEPLTGWGMLLMIANVLAGFFTLGLLLSVLANIFARRA
jgi:uncharacterized protein YjbI with pentapeptide repeats